MNNQTNFDTQPQSLFATKKIRYPALSRSMADPGEDIFREDYDAVALRCRALEELYADGNGVKFAVDIKVEYATWNAAANNGQVSKVVAFKIRRAHPDIDPLWIWFGNTDGQPPRLTRQLEVAMATAAVNHGIPYPTTGKGTTRAS